MRSGTTLADRLLILNHMAGLYAMQDQFETAHATLSRR